MTRTQIVFASLCLLCLSVTFMHHQGYNIISILPIQDNVISSNAQNFTKARSTAIQLCAAGHIKNVPPICGAGGCLRNLVGRKNKVFLPPMKNFYRHHVETINGWLAMLHVEVVWYLTQAQRHFRIWGSVGEIGVYHGKYTAILAYGLDVEAGERLFICDVFGDSRHMKLNTEAARRDIFEKNMQTIGFSMYSKDEKKSIRVWDDSSLYLSKSVFLDMNLPSFRLFSIDGNHNKPFILLDLLTVTCIIKDGGIIAVDDVVNSKWPDVRSSINEYFMHFGEYILKPLVLIYGKMYLVTSNWHSRYMRWMELHGVPVKLKLRKRKGSYFGPYCTYYVI